MTYLQRGPKAAIANLLIDDWEHPDVVAARDSWAHSGHFDPAAWIHTGWYTFDNPNPQVTVSQLREGSASGTGWNAIDPTSGYPVEWVDGRVNVDVWVREGDTDPDEYTGGVNPKQYTEELMRRVQLVAHVNSEGTTYNGEPEFNRLGTGTPREPEQPDDPDVEHRMRVPVLFGWDRRL